MLDQLPSEVLEKILCYLSPYGELDNAMLVCKRMQTVGENLLHLRQCRFVSGIEQHTPMHWFSKKLKEDSRTTPSKRFGCSVVYHYNSLYLFGGATTQRTTFNDLWQYDLTIKQWKRLMPQGRYPPPRACASGLVFHNNFLVYGGFELQPTSLMWVRNQWLNSAYLYDIVSNQWSSINLYPSNQTLISLTSKSNKSQSTTGIHSVFEECEPSALPNTLGHSACILLKNKLVLYGGHTMEGLLSTLYVIELGTGEWSLVQPIGSAQPVARFGHAAVALDDERMLVLGGDSGPNKRTNDIWLLQVDSTTQEHWWWTKVCLSDPPPSISSFSCSLLCGAPSSLKNWTGFKIPSKGLVMIVGAANSQLEEYLQQGERQRHHELMIPPTTTNQLVHSTNQPPQYSQAAGASNYSASSQSVNKPSIRPNARADRQKQLQSIQRFEEQMRQNLANRRDAENDMPTDHGVIITTRHHTAPRKHPLCIFCLNIENLLSTSSHYTNQSDTAATAAPSPTVYWSDVNPISQSLEYAPSDRLGYAAALAKQELFVIGGLVSQCEPTLRRFVMKDFLMDPMMRAESDPSLFELSDELFVYASEFCDH